MGICRPATQLVAASIGHVAAASRVDQVCAPREWPWLRA